MKTKTTTKTCQPSKASKQKGSSSHPKACQKMQDASRPSRLMAGVFVATGHHELGLTALEKVIACHELKHQKELELI